MCKVKEEGLKILDCARAYSKSAYILNTIASQKRELDLLSPSTVNAALSIELYFKVLHLIVFSTDFKIKNKYSHDFFEIFMKLNFDMRNEMDISFINQIKNRDMCDVNNMEKMIIKEKKKEFKIPITLSENLNIWKEVFTKCRYQYENCFNGPIFFFPEIEKVVTEQIFILKPEWEKITYSVYKKCH